MIKYGLLKNSNCAAIFGVRVHALDPRFLGVGEAVAGEKIRRESPCHEAAAKRCRQGKGGPAVEHGAVNKLDPEARTVLRQRRCVSRDQRSSAADPADHIRRITHVYA